MSFFLIWAEGTSTIDSGMQQQFAVVFSIGFMVVVPIVEVSTYKVSSIVLQSSGGMSFLGI